MSDEKNDRIDLAEMVVALRRELLAAQKEGDGKDLKFIVEDVDIELQVAVTKSAEVGVGVKFWLMDAKAKGDFKSEAVQKIRLKLKPEWPDGNDKISDRGRKPPEH